MDHVEQFRPSTNIEFACLGDHASSRDTNAGAMQKCLADVTELRGTGVSGAGTSGMTANDQGVSAVRNGVLYNLEHNNIGAVEKFLKDPSTQNIPAGGEALDNTQFGWTATPEKPMTLGGMPVNPDIAHPLESMGEGIHNMVSRLKGYDLSPEHKDELVRKTTDLLKSPAGHDLVIQYDHENGPN